MSIPDVISSDSINPPALSSPNSGNILMLLNVLYTPGFTLHTPNHPLLNGQIFFFFFCKYLRRYQERNLNIGKIFREE